MTESIEIRNAGPLKYVRIDNIRQFTVLIGESGSGKSVLMKTLMLMHDDLTNYYGTGTTAR